MMKQAKMTRWSLLQAAALAGGGLAARSGFGATSPKATAFALCGDESHNSDYIRTALTSTLVEDGRLSIDFTDEEKLLTYENLKNYKILIMFRDGLRFPNGYYQAIYWTGKPEDIVSVPPLEKKIGGRPLGWTTDAQGKAIKSWVQEGGSLRAFHNNSQASIMNRDYFRVLYCFFVIEHHRRQTVHFNVTTHPTSEWIVQRQCLPSRRT